MKAISFGWLWRKPRPWVHLQQVPFRHLSLFLAAVFLLFSVIGFYVDLMSGGTMPYAIVVTIAILSGANAVLWVLVVTRLPAIFIFAMIVKEFLPTTRYLTGWVQDLLHPAAIPPLTGQHFAATAILIAIIASYVCFSSYIGIGGREAFRLRNELSLAHGIQKTLVPPIQRTTAHFEIYGISHPSEKVGGDLVDVVELPNGDCIAYLADIAGHGLQAGILMGMLKTAARTALTSSSGNDRHATGITGGQTLCTLMERLNTVLPQVKEAHMYATFTALRLNHDGSAFYGMAASPPLLQWLSGEQRMRQFEEQQFPLGLLPVTGFTAHPIQMIPGDILVVATDGILEVNNQRQPRKHSGPGEEFGVESLAGLIAANATLPLPELAAVILSSVRSFGKQLDDQTLLLVRRTG